MGRPKGRRAGENSRLSLGHAKGTPSRAWDVRGGVAGVGVSRARKTSAKLRASFGTAERTAGATNREAAFPPKGASRGAESTRGQAVFLPKNGSAFAKSSFRPKSESYSAKSATAKAGFGSGSAIAAVEPTKEEAARRWEGARVAKSTSGDADLRTEGASQAGAGDTAWLSAPQPERRTHDCPGNVLGRRRRGTVSGLFTPGA